MLRALFLLFAATSTTAAFHLASRPAGRSIEAAVLTFASSRRKPSCNCALWPIASSSTCHRAFFVRPARRHISTRPAGELVETLAYTSACAAASANARKGHTLSKRPAGAAVEMFALAAVRAVTAARLHEVRQLNRD